METRQAIYRVRGIDLDHDGTRYPEGGTITLDEATAKRLGNRLAYWAEVPAPAPPASSEPTTSTATPAEASPPSEAPPPAEPPATGKKR